MSDTMPKVELHVHLDVALPPPAILQLAGRHNALLPGDTEDAIITGWFVFRDFYHFVDVKRVIKVCVQRESKKLGLMV